MGLRESPYMTLNFKSKTRKKFPSVIHVDGTCRVQTVEKGFLYNLLKQFYKKTGCPFLLNTSFNIAGSPLIQTKAEAVQLWKDSRNPSFAGVYFVDDKKLYNKN